MAEEKKETIPLNDDDKRKNEFSDNLLSVLAASNHAKQNLICSPLSISTIMTICMVGSKGNTLKQMSNVLYPNSKRVDRRKIAKNVIALSKEYNSTFNSEYGPTLLLSNKIWINEGTKIFDSYIKNTSVDVFQIR